MMKKLFGRGKKDKDESSAPSSSPPTSPPGASGEGSGSPGGGHEGEIPDDGQGKQCGIGVVFLIGGDKGLYVKEMSEGGAAAESGILEVGDCIMSIDGHTVYGAPPEEISKRIKGKLGSPVAVKFRRNIVLTDGRCVYSQLAPVLTRGSVAELPQPAGIGVIFKVGHDGGMYVKALSEDGAANASGVIQIDDLLMEVNGKPVYRKAVTLVTPMLLGSFGTVIVLTFARKGENGKEATVKVKLVRGKRATFNTKDQSEKKKNAARMANMISVEVPPEFGPGDVLDCKDSYGNLVQVQVPEGAQPGTLLRVPMPPNPPEGDDFEKDPAVFEQLMNDLREVPGKKNLFLWRARNREVHPLRHNADGSVTVEAADNDEVLWHGHPNGPGISKETARVLSEPQRTVSAGQAAIAMQVQKGAPNSTPEAETGGPDVADAARSFVCDRLRNVTINGKASTGAAGGSGAAEGGETGAEGRVSSMLRIEKAALPDAAAPLPGLQEVGSPGHAASGGGGVDGGDEGVNDAPFTVRGSAHEEVYDPSKVTLMNRAKFSVLDDKKVDTEVQLTSVSEALEEWEKLIAM